MQPQLIAGRYQVLRAIGHGGMGTVWLCRDELLGREVAVKQIGALPGDSSMQTKRAMREARSAAALNHVNAVAVYDVLEHEGRPWLVMEYVEGETLAAEMARDGQLSPHRVADIGAQLASALARAHERRIVHRDIKPGNVLIDKGGRPKISDFGIARGYGDEQLTQVGFVTGTPGFLSPELARGGDPHPTSDVWALGATLYAAVEGQPPYEPRSNPIALLRAIATERPRPTTHAGAIKPAIDAMMHEDPTCRWDMATCARRLAAIARANAPAVTPRGASPDTKVIAVPSVVAPPVETQAVVAPPVETRAVAAEPVETQVVVAEPVETQAVTAPPVETPAVVAPPVETPPVETQAMVAPPVETQAVEAKRVEAARLEPSASRDLGGGAAVPPDTRRGGRRRLPLLLAALLVAVFGVAFLSSQLGDQSGTTAHPGPSATDTPTSPGPSSPPRTTSSVPSTTAVTVPPKDDKSLAKFVSSYYSDVTKHTDRTWGQLTPKMQVAAGGRTGYNDFWETIKKVKVNETRANASSTSAVVNLTFTRNDGTTSNETHEFTFVTKNGDYLIDSVN